MSVKKNSAHKSAQRRYHDIVFAPGLNKDYKTEKEIFRQIFALSAPIDIYKNSILTNYDTTSTNNTLNSVLAKAYYFEDSDKVIFKTLDLFYKRNKLTRYIDFGIDAGLFSIEKKDVNRYSGTRYGASVFYKHFSLRAGINKYNDFSEFVPTVTYQNRYRQHSYSLEYTRKNALFYTYNLKPYRKRITANHFSITDYVTLSNNTSLWATIELNIFSNNDIGKTAQFDWRFYYNTAYKKKFTYDIALEGWYTAHSLEHDDFYSPNFYDSTLFRFNPQYNFSNHMGIKGQVGAGYSIKGLDIPYKYGLWVFGNPIRNFSYTAGCLESTAVQPRNSTGYSYIECKLNLEYTW